MILTCLTTFSYIGDHTCVISIAGTWHRINSVVRYQDLFTGMKFFSICKCQCFLKSVNVSSLPGDNCCTMMSSGLRGNNLVGNISPDLCQLTGLWYL